MKTITSRSNPLYRQLLGQFKHAGRPGHAVWLEGVHLCQAWLMHQRKPQWALFAQEAQDSAEIGSLASQVSSDRQIWFPQKLLASLSTLVTAPSVIFVGELAPVIELEISESLPKAGSWVLLDAIQDPGNVGTMLRTAAAAGIKSVVAGLGTAACWSPKVLRAGQGAQFALDIYESIDLCQVVKSWLSQDKRPLILATALDPQAKSLHDLDLNRPVAWIFGNEGLGVSPSLLALADHKVSIDYESEAVESLNVSSAAAICLFEQRRQSRPIH